MKLTPKNWDKFQQYKDRKPTWIKLHRELLNDFSYSSVQIGTKATLPLLWLLACEYDDGVIDASIEEISFRIHIDKDTVNIAIKELVGLNFFSLASECIKPYKMVPREETELETEKKKEVITKSFDDSIRLANYLLNNILKVKPNFKKPNIENWAKDIDKAIRIDKRTVQQLKDCIDWIYSPNGEFWQPNILSGEKLRHKFDVMDMQVIKKSTSKEALKLSEEAQTWANVYRKKGFSDDEIIQKLKEGGYINE